MRRFLRVSLALVLIAFSAGCAQSAPNIRHAALSIKLLKTHRDGVAGMLGEPEGVVELSDHFHGCLERWSYTGGRVQNGEEVLFVDFDDQGRVCDVAWGHTAMRY